MIKVKKTSVYFLILILVLQYLPIQVAANTSIEESVEQANVEKMIVFSKVIGGTTDLFQEDSKNSEILTKIPDDTEITVLEKNSEFSKISYVEKVTENIWLGYVLNDSLIESLKAEEYRLQRTSELTGSDVSEETKGTNELAKEEDGMSIVQEPAESDDLEGDVRVEKQLDRTMKTLSAQNVAMNGIALQSPTNIYSTTSTGSSILKSYGQGTILKYKVLSADWYEATVFVNGESITGYIHASDVTQNVKGIALKSPTNIYSSMSISSSILKSYTPGTILKFKVLSRDWYEATVVVNGTKKTGYLRAEDVQNLVFTQETLRGIGIKSPTKIYSKASKSSKAWKEYSQGTILKYRTLSKDWYEATIYVNGISRTGYFSVDDVQNLVDSQEAFRGISMKSPTSIYSRASTSSKVLKSYAQGVILQYRTLSKDWNEVTVYVNGKRRTGYIKKSDVQNIVDVQETVKGVALKNPTRIYSRASTNSNVWKSYVQGAILKYRTLSKDWYEATITISGKKKIGYIKRSDVENATSNPTNQYVLGLLKNVNVYSYASTKAKVLKSYGKNNVLKVQTFTSSWYSVTFYINGKEGSGYIKKTDVRGSYSKVRYNISLKDAIAKQLGYNPVTEPVINGKWTPATSKQVEAYLNPQRFSIGSNEYFQFLLLSSYAGTNASEVNQKILNGKGILEGKASYFITAAKTHKINEIYLISHSLLETGNGTSSLAKGIKVNGKTVYNVYGIGAFDRDPERLGAQYAYEQGWTTLEKAIIGGAQFVSENYIHAGQDTLYKMRWNPEAMVEDEIPHQYASDIGWAVKQTTRIAEMYGLLTRYALFFDVPDYL
ncbi:N-acetylglucosaminidase [Bacillus massilinigeriensis]|uniref:N-acetylglucosaminidase n=1 Tax=Bacillus massilionigeriensis TaxID=1805475 RepID=UPI00096B1DC5|nr:N-acetylglucosaminidase [Bacillus massilionigeriensis]